MILIFFILFSIIFFIILASSTAAILMWGISLKMSALIVLTWFGIIWCFNKNYWQAFFILSICLLVNNVLFSYVIFNSIIDSYCEMLIGNLVFSLESTFFGGDHVTHFFIPIECSNIDFELFENSKPVSFLFKRNVIFKSIILSNYGMAFCSVTLYDTPFIDLLLFENVPTFFIPFVKQHLLNNCFCGHISLELANILELYK